MPLMPKPFAVLQHLVDRAGQLVTQDQLLEAIWPDTFVQPEVLRRYILEVRRALDDQAGSPRFVQTFPKRGYQFIAEVIDHSSGTSHRPFGRCGDGAVTGKLVGRASALADLRRYLDADARGRRHVIFVVGEPGIGKTSLMDAFQRLSARWRALSRRTRTLSGGGARSVGRGLRRQGAVLSAARSDRSARPRSAAHARRRHTGDIRADLADPVSLADAAGTAGGAAAGDSRRDAGTHGARTVRSARSNHADRAAGADPRRSALGRSFDAGRDFSDRAAARARAPARARHAAAGGIDPLRQPAQSVEAGSAAAPFES